MKNTRRCVNQDRKALLPPLPGPHLNQLWGEEEERNAADVLSSNLDTFFFGPSNGTQQLACFWMDWPEEEMRCSPDSKLEKATSVSQLQEKSTLGEEFLRWLIKGSPYTRPVVSLVSNCSGKKWDYGERMLGWAASCTMWLRGDEGSRWATLPSVDSQNIWHCPFSLHFILPLWSAQCDPFP